MGGIGAFHIIWTAKNLVPMMNLSWPEMLKSQQLWLRENFHSRVFFWYKQQRHTGYLCKSPDAVIEDETLPSGAAPCQYRSHQGLAGGSAPWPAPAAPAGQRAGPGPHGAPSPAAAFQRTTDISEMLPGQTERSEERIWITCILIGIFKEISDLKVPET